MSAFASRTVTQKVLFHECHFVKRTVPGNGGLVLSTGLFWLNIFIERNKKLQITK